MKTASELRDAALDMLMDDPDEAVRLAREALSLEPEVESHYVLGVALSEAGEPEAALSSLRSALELDDAHANAWAALGRCLFDRCDFDEARLALLTALRLDPLQPEALYYRACLRERRGDNDGAARDYAAANQVAPEEFPVPVPLRESTIRETVERIDLPPSLRRYLSQVPIVVEDVPDEEVLRLYDPPLRPTELLGCFQGPPLADRDLSTPWASIPPAIYLFRCNLQRIAVMPGALAEELRLTLLHELGHFLGLDETELEEPDFD